MTVSSVSFSPSGLLTSLSEGVYDLESKKTATFWDIFLLGITIVLGGQFYAWNEGLDEGFWCFLASTAIMGVGYFCLTLCLAEMTSALPFSGGLYGFVRVTTNPMWGFVVAICEVFQNIFYIAATLLYLGEIMRDSMQNPEGSISGNTVEILTWIIFFVTAVLIHAIGGSIFLKVSGILALYTMLVVVCYLIFSIPYGDFQVYATSLSHRVITTTGVINRFSLASWFYIGIETLPLSCVYCVKPRRDVPRAMVWCMVVFFVSALAIVFAACSNAPGIDGLLNSSSPLSPVFAKVLKIKDGAAMWITVPAVYTTAFGFLFSLSRQMSSMSQSGMIPSLLKAKTSWSGSPYGALLMGTVGVLTVCFPVTLKYNSFKSDIFVWCAISSYFTYMLMFISFIELRKTFGLLERSFVNPLGIPSALIGMAVFTMNFISNVAFQGLDQPIQHRIHPIAGFAVFILFAMVWYYIYARHYQCFSTDEQKIMFGAYVIKSNVKGKKRLKASPNRRTSHGRNIRRNSNSATSDGETSMQRFVNAVTFSSVSTSKQLDVSGNVSRSESITITATESPASTSHTGVTNNDSQEGLTINHVPSFAPTPTLSSLRGMDIEKSIPEDRELVNFHQSSRSQGKTKSQSGRTFSSRKFSLDSEDDGGDVIVVHDTTIAGINQIKASFTRATSQARIAMIKRLQSSKSIAQIVPLAAFSRDEGLEVEQNDDEGLSSWGERMGGNVNDGKSREADDGEIQSVEDNDEYDVEWQNLSRIERLKQFMTPLDRDDDDDTLTGAASDSKRRQYPLGAGPGPALGVKSASFRVRNSVVGFFQSLSRSQDNYESAPSQVGRFISLSKLESFSERLDL